MCKPPPYRPPLIGPPLSLHTEGWKDGWKKLMNDIKEGKKHLVCGSWRLEKQLAPCSSFLTEVYLEEEPRFRMIQYFL